MTALDNNLDLSIPKPSIVQDSLPLPGVADGDGVQPAVSISCAGQATEPAEDQNLKPMILHHPRAENHQPPSALGTKGSPGLQAVDTKMSPDSRTAKRPSLAARSRTFIEEQAKKGSRFSKHSFLSQIDNARHQDIQSRKARYLVDPNGEFMKRWDVITTLALIFTAIVTPFEVAFLATEVNGLFVINRLVDVVFVSDMALQFFLMYEVRDQDGIHMVKNRGSIARHYISGWFFVDVLSTLPFDVAGYALQSDDLRNMKSLRMVRLFRLLKLVRILRASRILARWQTAIAVSFTVQSLVKFASMLIMGGHWMACVWGLIGMETEGYCWIDALADNKPDGMPIVKSPAYAFELYCASLHFAVMTMTSIGYGDISPMQASEYIACVIFQGCGGLMWAIGIGSMSSIMSTMDMDVKRYKQTMDELNNMMKSRSLPADMRQRLRRYFIEARELHSSEAFKSLLKRMSPSLQGSVARVANDRWLQCVWYFKTGITDRFVSDIAKALQARVFADGEMVDKWATLNILTKGISGRGGMVLRQGSVWGEDFLLRYAPLRKEIGVVSLTYIEVQSLTQRDFFEILQEASPQDMHVIRKATVKLAVYRGVVHQANIIKGKSGPQFNSKGLWGRQSTSRPTSPGNPPSQPTSPVAGSPEKVKADSTGRGSLVELYSTDSHGARATAPVDVASLEALVEKTVRRCLREELKDALQGCVPNMTQSQTQLSHVARESAIVATQEVLRAQAATAFVEKTNAIDIMVQELEVGLDGPQVLPSVLVTG